MKKKSYKSMKSGAATSVPQNNPAQRAQSSSIYGESAGAGEQKMPLSEKNYLFILIGFVVIFIGFLLMSGGASASPDEFNYEMFSFRRITLAPIVVVIGFVIEIYAILKRF